MLPLVVYTTDEQLLIDAFEAMTHKNGDYWTEPAIATLKARIKQHYRSAQGWTCCYCRQVVSSSHGRSWDTEHIVPRSTHAVFMFTALNLAAACPECNGAKSNHQTLLNPRQVDPQQSPYPKSGADFHIIHPHFDRYDDHIEKAGYVYAALTAKGTWTINKCNLARFAGRVIGWPEPPTDTRFEQSVDKAAEGDLAAVLSIASELNAALESSSST